MNKTKIIQNIIVNLENITDSLEALIKVLNESVNSEEAAVRDSKGEAKLKDTQEQKKPTLEEVRAAMAEKNREGHREEIKAIIVNHGANKLTSLDPKYYAKVLKEVGEIK
ncbi:hypothetical protein D9O40_03480 [Clostridium autoethanogenum]|uniref:rRNA biogenesis protein rrp5 n=1 Tax=Clostridium autoethanogenum TaxID=84023 RepID=A0A3M0SZ61_9CLOT|nr:hypothetical protein [Clostridium autoethanogenum]RMD03215.1 hypothetical protein D9O40_03480 [Clostridium autoethanogenum]